MAVSVYVPSPFRRLTGNRSQVEAHGKDVAELLEDLERQFPGFRSLVFNDDESRSRPTSTSTSTTRRSAPWRARRHPSRTAIRWR